MANPPTAKPFEQALDPSDLVDFYVVISQGRPDAKPATVLLLGEAVARYELKLTAEAIALGLSIADGPGYQNRLEGNVLRLWLELDPSMQASAMFNGEGVTIAIELLVNTTSNPPRTKERSFLLRIANQ